MRVLWKYAKIKVSQREEEKKTSMGSRTTVNVVLSATNPRGDEDGVQGEEFLLNSIDVREVSA